jgi:ABC-2 type transport system permease protein
MISKLLAIAGNTFTQTIRQPVFGVLLWVAVALLLINPSIAAYSLSSGNDNKILTDVGLSTLLLYGLLASVFSAVTVITQELESFTVLTVVSKPVSRTIFLCGKYLGVTVAVLAGFIFLSTVFMLTVRHGVMETVASKYDQPVLAFGGLALLISLIAAAWCNYVYGWNFATTLFYWAAPLALVAFAAVSFFGPQWQFEPPWAGPAQPESLSTPVRSLVNVQQALAAVAMIFGNVIVLTAIAVALATRFSQVITLLLCTGVFLVTLLSDYLFGAPAAKEGAAPIFGLLYAIIPNSQFFWAGDAVTQERIIPLTQVGLVLTYAALWALAILNAGIAMFQTREVGS